MNSYSYNYNPDHEVEEVKALGPDYFVSLIYKVESRGVRVFDVTKSIVNQFQFGGTVSQKQASVLMNFNRKFGS